MIRFRLQTMLGLCLGATLCLGQACTVRSGTGSSDDDDASDEKEPMDAGAGDVDSEVDSPPSEDAGMDSSEADPFDGIVKRPPPSLSRTEPATEPDATDVTSAGEGDLETTTEQTDDEGDKRWDLEFDVDGDGVDDKVTVVYDDETKRQYTSWDGAIEGFCLDGTDSDASFTLIYDHGTKDEILIWHSDCEEDESVTYGCDVTEDGELLACGTCVFNSEWICSESAEPADLVQYQCVCEVTCDDQDVGLEIELCDLPDDVESALALAEPVCEDEFAADGCDKLVCDCSCTETAMVCE